MDDKSRRKAKILDMVKEAAKRGRTAKKMETAPVLKQSIKGNNNYQSGRDLTVNISTPKTPILKISPSNDSIGSDPFLKQAIITGFNAIAEEREKRFGKTAYSVMYNKFKSDFGIKNAPWTIIWTWPKGCAGSIIDYLDKKFANTIQGRIRGAAQKEGYIHSRGHLYKMEKELLSHLDLTMDSPEVRECLADYFGVSSHTKLSHLQQWQWVCYLEDQVRKLEEQ